MTEKTQAGESTKDAAREPQPGIARVLGRALRQRCPRCGRGKIYDRGWYNLRDRCPDCEYEIEGRAGDQWAVFYITTAAVPGLLILVVVFLPPPESLAGRLVWFGFFLGLMISTMQVRRSIGVALDYLGRRAWPNPRSGRADFDDAQ